MGNVSSERSAAFGYLVIAGEAKQSIAGRVLDCFALALLAMTAVSMV
jgi:hypothetical protein